MSTTPADADPPLSAADIRRVLEALDASDWDSALITVGNVRIAVARNGAALPGTAVGADSRTVPSLVVTPAEDRTAPAPAPERPPTPVPASEPAPDAKTGVVVTSPSVGVFWRAPEPGAPPFAEVGGHVSAGDTLCIVEVMKLMSHVDAPVPGTVVEIHADNAQSVEHGAKLFTILPDEV